MDELPNTRPRKPHDAGRDRVVITGVGVVCPLGLEPDTCFRALIEGRSGVRALPEALARHSIGTAGLVDAFDAAAVVGKKNVKRTARFVQLALAAARNARADAELDRAGYPAERVGTIVGSALGGLDLAAEAIEDFRDGGPRRVSPYTLAASISNIAPGMIAIDAGFKGPCYCTVSGWASSSEAIAHGYRMLQRGAADAVLAGGSEALNHHMALALLGHNAHFATASAAQPAAHASRPFDRERQGIVPSEGAAVLVLETLSFARKRGARIYAELAGCGSSYALPEDRERGEIDHPMVVSMRNALSAARIDASDVGYVNAYGSASRDTDVFEASALQQVFGAHARTLWVSSNKGAAGHLLGASGAFEAAMTAITLARGIVPPTANLETPDERCRLDCMPGAARERRMRAALSNTFAETGHNVSLAFKAYDGRSMEAA